MKATARKIKDNEWIAEVLEKVMIIRGNRYMRDRHDTEPEPALCDKDGNYFYWDIKTYPIVSPSDKEWLEKNNMDGKEVEGDITHPTFANGRLKELKQVFALTSPPIHSDPAGEEDYKKAWESFFDLIREKNADLANSKRATNDYKERWETCLKTIRIMESQPSTPQTGRTYTEGVNNFLDFLIWFGTIEEVDRSVYEGNFNQYLKQNPKP